MLVLAGGGIAATGLLVVFGALTGRLAAMLAAAFKPADLQPGFSSASGQTLGQFMTPGLPGGAPAGTGTGQSGLPKLIPGSTVVDPLATLYPQNPAPVIAPPSTPGTIQQGRGGKLG